ncbi:hypothetical protein C440_04233 [Haloferax mucosum ATCC BAA-1512]|uniref:DUF5518 domain-containing protein n=1 Tax=Haloferax mucosum ATCC BAA-1512 TaxID=662479 RepID=M0INB2_9EURY|nr:DUF5518 domain-containing protein [Haloferax mucosum]ELZ96954.1 hypothetical protein C440_04233 [Haloferax mucosum ATCC BAA-1512]
MEHSPSSTTDASFGDEGESLLFSAVIGGIVSIVLAPIPFSPVLGGALAGYLTGTDRTRGAKSGGLSGLIVGIVTAVLTIVGLLFFGLFALGTAPNGFGLGIVGIVIVLLFSLLIGGLYTVGLGALGGYLGAYLNEEFN